MTTGRINQVAKLYEIKPTDEINYNNSQVAICSSLASTGGNQMFEHIVFVKQ